jgi:hypothetical protein
MPSVPLRGGRAVEGTGRLFSTSSRPALRAAASGGRPRPATDTRALASTHQDYDSPEFRGSVTENFVGCDLGSCPGSPNRVETFYFRLCYCQFRRMYRMRYITRVAEREPVLFRWGHNPPALASGSSAPSPSRRHVPTARLGAYQRVGPIAPTEGLPRARRRLPTRQVVNVDGPHPAVQLLAVAATSEPCLSSPAMPSLRPIMGRAVAADHPGSAVSSGQPRTTTAQVSRPVGW